MSKKTILVTGASSGIGRATCVYLASQGYRIVALARNEERLKELSQQLGSDDIYIPYDLLELEKIEDVFKTCKEQGIKLDGLVHCAGINNSVPIRANDVEAMQRVTTVNYFAFVELGKYFSKKKYSSDGASIVAVSSIAALSCERGMCTYASSKAALNAAVKVMSKEFIPRGIRVNALLPAFVDTGMSGKFISGVYDLDEKVEKSMPFGIIPPEQIAYYAEFLLSDRSSYITGALLPISGAYTQLME
ncbi:MAG: SDR family oxidoreductase [Lachnospiraceae bacterium]|nr:SDR family oxidoreductase [Lachnospiraceae bacterium]